MTGLDVSDATSKVAFALIHSGCLKSGSFRIKSGAWSPYYIDLASLLSSPKDFCTLVNITADEIRRLAVSERIDQLASIELKGVLLLPTIGCQRGLPCTIVRKEKKTYGTTGKIAGAEVIEDEHVLFFDDVVSEGLSKLEGMRSLEKLGARVESIMVVGDREQGGKKTLEDAGYKLHSLSRVSELVDSLSRSNDISAVQAEAVLDYIKREQGRHGLLYVADEPARVARMLTSAHKCE